jgi:hypothetical protein
LAEAEGVDVPIPTEVPLSKIKLFPSVDPVPVYFGK